MLEFLRQQKTKIEIDIANGTIYNVGWRGSLPGIELLSL